MQNETPTDITPTESGTTPGFFARILGRIDQAMKQAAEKKSSRCCNCCSGASNKDGDGGGKCC